MEKLVNGIAAGWTKTGAAAAGTGAATPATLLGTATAVALDS